MTLHGGDGPRPRSPGHKYLDDLIKAPFRLPRSGLHATVPDGPGLGIEVDEAKIAKYAHSADAACVSHEDHRHHRRRQRRLRGCGATLTLRGFDVQALRPQRGHDRRRSRHRRHRILRRARWARASRRFRSRSPTMPARRSRGADLVLIDGADARAMQTMARNHRAAHRAASSSCMAAPGPHTAADPERDPRQRADMLRCVLRLCDACPYIVPQERARPESAITQAARTSCISRLFRATAGRSGGGSWSARSIRQIHPGADRCCRRCFPYTNAIHHPPAIAAAMSGACEATGGDYYHYYDGITPCSRAPDRCARCANGVAVAAALGVAMRCRCRRALPSHGIHHGCGARRPALAYDVFHQQRAGPLDQGAGLARSSLPQRGRALWAGGDRRARSCRRRADAVRGRSHRHCLDRRRACVSRRGADTRTHGHCRYDRGGGTALLRSGNTREQ